MKKLGIEFKWAVIFVLVSLAWMVLEKFVGLHGPHIDKHAIYTNLFAIPAIAVYIFALLEKRRNFYEGMMTYKQGFVTGVIITMMVTVLAPLTQYITSAVISPEYFPNVINYTVREGTMTLPEAERYFTMGNYIIQSLIGTLVMGLITTAAVAFFTKRSASQIRSEFAAGAGTAK